MTSQSSSSQPEFPIPSPNLNSPSPRNCRPGSVCRVTSTAPTMTVGAPGRGPTVASESPAQCGWDHHRLPLLSLSHGERGTRRWRPRAQTPNYGRRPQTRTRKQPPPLLTLGICKKLWSRPGPRNWSRHSGWQAAARLRRIIVSGATAPASDSGPDSPGPRFSSDLTLSKASRPLPRREMAP